MCTLLAHLCVSLPPEAQPQTLSDMRMAVALGKRLCEAGLHLYSGQLYSGLLGKGSLPTAAAGQLGPSIVWRHPLLIVHLPHITLTCNSLWPAVLVLPFESCIDALLL